MDDPNLLPVQQSSFGLTDLELMHKFSTETYKSLCNDSSDYDAWQIVVPQKALEYDFLLNGVLAVAALHRTTTAVDALAALPQTTTAVDTLSTLPYVDKALQYYNRAFAPFQQALDNLTPLNCEAIFAHSIIITVISVALPQFTTERNKGQSMTENIIVIFELLQGVKRIMNISKPWLKTKLFTRRHDFLKDPVPDPETLDSMIPGAGIAFAKLSNLNNTLASFDPEQHHINKESISLLCRCYLRYVTTREPSAVLTWISAVGKDFAHCLRRRQPFPLLILMHWGVLLGELDGEMWWAKNSGKALVAELLIALPTEMFQWDGAQLWPKERLGL